MAFTIAPTMLNVVMLAMEAREQVRAFCQSAISASRNLRSPAAEFLGRFKKLTTTNPERGFALQRLAK